MALPIGTPRPCKGCGTTIFKSKFCTNECRVGWYERTKDQRWRETARSLGMRPITEVRAERHANAIRRQCPECGKLFRPTRYGNHQKGEQRLCSRECHSAVLLRARTVRRAVRAEAAVYRSWAQAARRREREAELAAQTWEKPCVGCGVTVAGRWVVMCEVCRDDRARTRKRSARLAGKARKRAVTVECFDPIEVLTRDGWRCHICGIKTPKRLRGSYEDNAPELDHIVPLAAGGEHSRRNTACSCRKCNIAKADKPLGQMRLAA